MRFAAVREQISVIIPILLGTAIYAFGIYYFIISNELMEGGLTGISILFNYAFGIPPSITILILNIPLFFLGWKVLGKRGMIYTIIGTISLSFFMWVMELFIDYEWIIPFRTESDYFLATLYAGLTIGSGLGIVFRYGGTTGGSDIVARVANKLKGWSMGQVILVIDVLVISSSLLFIPREKVLYTLVAVFIAAKMIDYITEGAYAGKAFTIITESAGQMAELITLHMERGVTLLQGRGAYSGNDKEIVYCVVYRHEVRRLKQMIREVDSSAFIVIHDVQDVLGEGFRNE